jgi:GrpB-like predicted nucleotidyltransferase (UPF0157 family)
MKMVLHEYNERWSKDFMRIKSVLIEALSGIEISIEHIGSTSVPQLAAKQIIDIDVIFYDKGEFELLKRALRKIGYFHNGNQGIINREVFKREESIERHNILDSIAHHLYVCPNDSEELKRHILVRDFLIANEAAKMEYQNLKYEIAKEANQDKKRYAQLKEMKSKYFVDTIIEQAISNQTL